MAMSMVKIEEFLRRLRNDPASITFSDSMEVITSHYEYNATEFYNGDQHNAAGTNEGSCKILAFGQLQDLTVEETLQCFGDYYRLDVLQHPDADDHQNIRQFIKHGWQGVRFPDNALTEKQ